MKQRFDILRVDTVENDAGKVMIAMQKNRRRRVKRRSLVRHCASNETAGSIPREMILPRGGEPPKAEGWEKSFFSKYFISAVSIYRTKLWELKVLQIRFSLTKNSNHKASFFHGVWDTQIFFP